MMQRNTKGLTLTEFLVAILILFVPVALVFSLAKETFAPNGEDLVASSLHHIADKNYGDVSTDFAFFDNVHFEHRHESDTSGVLGFSFSDSAVCFETPLVALFRLPQYGFDITRITIGGRAISPLSPIDRDSILNACNPANSDEPVRVTVSYSAG